MANASTAPRGVPLLPRSALAPAPPCRPCVANLHTAGLLPTAGCAAAVASTLTRAAPALTARLLAFLLRWLDTAVERLLERHLTHGGPPLTTVPRGGRRQLR